MVSVCSGICKEHKAPKLLSYLRYGAGQKRCTLCDCYFVTDKMRCMCCSTKLRNKSRSRKRRDIKRI